MHEYYKEIVILYHGKCPDGFGGAYAAWKKFGNAATYIPVDHGDAPPEGLDGREVYLVDFCYETAEQMDALAESTKHLVVLDHHESAKELVVRAPEHVYDKGALRRDDRVELFPFRDALTPSYDLSRGWRPVSIFPS